MPERDYSEAEINEAWENLPDDLRVLELAIHDLLFDRPELKRKVNADRYIEVVEAAGRVIRLIPRDRDPEEQ